MYRVIIFVLFFSLAKNIFAQDSLNSKTVEDSTYRLYQSKNWRGLISLGNKALDNGFDYYYLRLRIGISYYEQKNYREAQKQFWKAYLFNSTDDVLMEYLYYCYIFNMQYDEARKLSKKFSSTLVEKLKTNKSPWIDYLFLESGIKTTDKPDLSDAYYGQFGFGHRVGKNISFFHAITLFDQNSQSSDLNQKQYYLCANIPVSKSWLISPAFHLIDRTITFKPQVYPPWVILPPGILAIPPPSTKNYYVGSVAITKSISKFDIGIGATYSNIDSMTQVQGNISLSYFPFGNNKLFFTSIGYIQQESVSPDYKYAFSQSVSVSPFSKLILSANYFYNQAHHISEMNGYLANNSNDLTTSRITFTTNFILSRHLNFYLLYQLENKSQNNPQNNTTTNYSYNNVFGGLKFIL